jgi:tetratricopeptide (TPR) repeat protein
MKNNQHILLLVILGCIIGGFFFQGCSTAKDSISSQKESINRDRALEHFMNGLLYDQRGQYADAILEYQEALKFEDDPAIYHALAKDYSALGKYASAVQMGREAVRRAPDNADYHATLADAYLRAFQIDDALQEYDEIIRIAPDNIQAWYSKARLLQLRAPLRAVEVYQNILDRFGPTWDVYLQMAQLYEQMGNVAKATSALKGALELDPANNDLRKSLADLYLQQDSIDTALNLYNELLELTPDDYVVRASVAHAYLVKKDYRRAAEQFEITITKDTLTVEQQIVFGQVFLSFIQKDSAVAPLARQLFESIKKSHPEDWRPYWFLAAISTVLHDDSAAMINYEKVVELARSNVEGWVGVASVYYERGEFEKSSATLEEAKRFVTDDFRIYFLLGIAYQRQHKAVEAAMALERAVQLNERSVDALSALGLVYDELKRHEDSDSAYEKALRLDPNNHLVLNNYGYSLAERGIQLERALTMAKRAVEQQPDNQAYLDTYGWVHFQLHNYETAEYYIKKAIELGTKSAVIHEHMGDIYSKLGQKEKAMEFWQKAYELDTTNTTLKAKIQRGSL